MHAFAANFQYLAAEPAALALVRSVLIHEAAFVAGGVLTMVGVMVQWQLPRRRMSMEERKKDGRITEAQSRRRIRLNGFLAPSLTIVGAVLMVGTAWGWY